MKMKPKTAAMVATAAAVMGLSGASTAAASEQPTDDEYYCRFFVDNIVGDVDHVQEVSGVRGFYWFTDEVYDVYFFTWRPEVGAALEFRRSDAVVTAMRGTVGFEPKVNYWECDEASKSD